MAHVSALQRGQEPVVVYLRTPASPTCAEVEAEVGVGGDTRNVAGSTLEVAGNKKVGTLEEVIQCVPHILVENICQHYQVRGLMVGATVVLVTAHVFHPLQVHIEKRLH